MNGKLPQIMCIVLSCVCFLFCDWPGRKKTVRSHNLFLWGGFYLAFSAPGVLVVFPLPDWGPKDGGCCVAQTVKSIETIVICDDDKTNTMEIHELNCRDPVFLANRSLVMTGRHSYKWILCVETFGSWKCFSSTACHTVHIIQMQHLTRPVFLFFFSTPVDTFSDQQHIWITHLQLWGFMCHVEETSWFKLT